MDSAVSAVGIAGWGARGAGAVSPPPSTIRGDPMDRLARNGREMPMLMLVSLSDSPDGRTRRLVASRASLSRRGSSRPGLPPEFLARFAYDPDSDVRGEVAGWVSAPLATCLAADEDWGVRSCVAANPLCPPETLATLARDEFESVRAEVAQHDACPPEALAMLADDRGHDVREYVAAHPSTPPQALVMLAGNSEGPTVRDGSTLAAIREDKRRDLRRRDILKALAGNPSTPAHLLGELAVSDDSVIRQKAVSNPSSGAATP